MRWNFTRRVHNLCDRTFLVVKKINFKYKIPKILFENQSWKETLFSLKSRQSISLKKNVYIVFDLE